MAGAEKRTIVVVGATGHQGGAVARHLLSNGLQVRALTRHPDGQPARQLAVLGATIVKGDMDDPASLTPAFTGVYGVYSVQNPYPSGTEGEIRQGRNVADAAKAAGVQHLVYGSAGTGQEGTGVPSWESKLQIEHYMRELGLPLTILRPMAFMELMTDRAFFPPMAAWHVMPALMGPGRVLPWLCTWDLGAIAARVFAEPQHFVGKDLKLASDERSIEECRSTYRAVLGRAPRRFPIPPGVFKRFGFVGRDLSSMWRWLRTGDTLVDVGVARTIHPEALSVEEWLRRQRRR